MLSLARSLLLKVKVFLFSQTFDVDKKLRALCDDLYLVKNVLRVFCYGKRIKKWPDLKQAEQEGEARIVDRIEYDSFLFAFFGSRCLIFIPRWSKYFKSFDPPVLSHFPLDLRLDPRRAPRWLRRSRPDLYDSHSVPVTGDDEAPPPPSSV